jgi:hypothetical protein
VICWDEEWGSGKERKKTRVHYVVVVFQVCRFPLFLVLRSLHLSLSLHLLGSAPASFKGIFFLHNYSRVCFYTVYWFEACWFLRLYRIAGGENAFFFACSPLPGKSTHTTTDADVLLFPSTSPFIWAVYCLPILLFFCFSFIGCVRWGCMPFSVSSLLFLSRKKKPSFFRLFRLSRCFSSFFFCVSG